MAGDKPFMGSREFTCIASRWTLFKARLFGKKYEHFSGPYHIVAYLWRGVWYITKYSSRY